MASPAVKFTLYFCALAALMVAPLLLPQTLRVTGHEGDLLHVLDAVYRVAAGDRPHIDFMTPLGMLAFLPIDLFVAAGAGPGRAFLLAQAVATLVVLPAIWWTSVSRLEGAARYVFAFVVLLLMTALVFGGAEPAVSVSMHYNRWAWALAFLVGALVMLRPRKGWDAAPVDGLILGLALTAMAFLKATFVAALLPFLVVALLLDRDIGRAGVTMVVAVVAAVGLSVAFGGVSMLSAYVGDLLAVAGSDARPRPGKTLADMVSKPEGLPVTILLIGAIVLWRRAGRAREGVLLLALAPGWVYITYQNWGNDPKYLALLFVLLIALPLPKPDAAVFGLPADALKRGLALAALLLILPSLLNMSYAPLRHLALSGQDFAPVFPNDAARADIEIRMDRNFIGRTQDVMAPVALPDGWTPPKERQTRLNGELLPACKLSTGFIGWTHQMLADLATQEELRDKRVVVADVYDHLWLFGPYRRGQQDAVWYYYGSDGLEDTDYVVVPFCSLSRIGRHMKLGYLSEMGDLVEVMRTPHFVLLRLDR